MAAGTTITKMTSQPFKPLPGIKTKLDDSRYVAVFPGEDGTYVMVFKNKENTTSIRLTKEAAIATAGLLTMLVGNGVDDGAPPTV